MDIVPGLNTISLGVCLWHQGPTRSSKPRQDHHCSGLVGWCWATQLVLFVLRYSLDVHAHHHAQGGVPCHGKVVPVVPQPDGVQPVLHCQTAGQVQETPVEGCLGEPGSRTEGVSPRGDGPRWLGCEVHPKEPVTLQGRAGQREPSQTGKSRHTAAWELLHMLDQTLAWGCHGGSTAVKYRMLPTAHHMGPTHVQGCREATAARVGQKYPLFAATHMLCPASAVSPCSSRWLKEPLPVHGGCALQVVRVADELVQDAHNLGEAWPLAAVLLPAIQHELVQSCGAAHGGRQAVAFLHRVNDLEGSHTPRWSCTRTQHGAPQTAAHREDPWCVRCWDHQMGKQEVCPRFMLNDKFIASELCSVSVEGWKQAGHHTHTRNHCYDSRFTKWSNRPKILQLPSSRRATRAALPFSCSTTGVCHCAARLEETLLKGTVQRR